MQSWVVITVITSGRARTFVTIEPARFHVKERTEESDSADVTSSQTRRNQLTASSTREAWDERLLANVENRRGRARAKK